MVYCKYSIKRLRALLFLRLYIYYNYIQLYLLFFGTLFGLQQRTLVREVLINKPSFWINDVTNGKIIAVFYMY